MAQFLLVSINASYSHTNLAVRSIREYVKKFNPSCDIEFGEWTINQPVGDVLRGIASFAPKFVLFSTYIWNGEFISKIIPDIKKILPDCIIGAGGPEFGFYADGYLNKLPALDFVMKGEGEETVLQLTKKVCGAADFVGIAGVADTDIDAESKDGPDISDIHASFCGGTGQLQSCSALFENVQGIYYRTGTQTHDALKKIAYTGDRPLLCDLSQIPFPYPSITDPDNRIYYYESSRGCPFSCSYCMSSLDKRVRFMPLERVHEDLQKFLDAGVKLVKFVDRTYNLQPHRYVNIWKYIVEHHNGKTMFHFEIEAEFLSEEALDFLQTVPSGVMQFEIGVQSANKETLRSINRSDNIEKLAQNIRRIPRTIHQHLDLIAGLPHENIESFGRSFDFVMSLHPDALQLGFLKILHGTQMESYAEKNGWKWMENPVYETFSTPFMPYADILFLKDVEILVDAYYNSGVFPKVMSYIERTCGFWNFFSRMVLIARKNDVFSAARRGTFWFEFLADNRDCLENFKCDESCGNGTEEFLYRNVGAVDKSDGTDDDACGLSSHVLYELLRYDFIRTGKKGGFPKWYVHNYSKDEHRRLLERNGGVKNARLDFAYSDFEIFSINPQCEEPEKTSGEYKILLSYSVKI